MKQGIIFVFTVWSLFANAQKFSSIEQYTRHTADSIVKNSAIPGIMIGVLNRGEAHYYSSGFANMEGDIPFDKTTIFEAGSITKTFTAYIVASVLSDHHIADTASIFSYLPDSVKTNRALEKVTFRSLLNHTSGLARLPSNMSLENLYPYDNYTLKNLYAYLLTVKLNADAGSSYSNTGTGLAGALAQSISEKSFQELLEQYIFTPFRMKDAASDPLYRKSQGYMPAKVGYWNMNILYPAGGLQTNCEQLLHYLSVMSAPPNAQKAIVEKVLTPTVTINKMAEMALAWHIFKGDGLPAIYWHNGGTYGFSTFAAFIKEQQTAVVVVINKFNQNGISDKFGSEIIKRLAAAE